MFNKISMFTILCTSLVLAACHHTPSPDQSVSAVSAAGVSAASSETSVASSRLPENAPILHVITTGSTTPFNYRDENGHVIGFESDLIHAIAANQGMRVQIITQKWKQIFNTIDNGLIDQAVAMDTIGVTEERLKKYYLSDSYIQVPNAIAVLEDSDIQKISDLNGKNISIMQNSEVVLDEMKAQHIQPAKIENRDSLYLALGAMMDRSADAVWGDKLVMAYYAKTMPNKKIRFIDLPEDGLDDGVVFLMNRKNTDLLNKINTGLANIKQNGTYNQIYQKWFGTK